MALFTKFKKAKDAAVEHKKNAIVQEAKPPPTPYKHIPTHAAQDALSSQPTTVRPEELQARIAAARKRKANSYQPPITPRQSIYHSCESSRASSRASSSMGLLPPPSSMSLKGKGSSNEAMDAVLRRSLSTHRHSTPVAGRQLQPSELFSPVLVGRPAFPPLANQRPRPPMASSRRSSFTKKKSPLSTVSLDEEAEETFPSSSNASARSAQSSVSDESKRNNSSDDGTGVATTVEPLQPSKQTIVANTPQIADKPLVRRKSKWSLLSRKTIDIAAH